VQLGVVGVAFGVSLVFALTRLVQAQLYGVHAFDPLTICSAVATLLVLFFLAAWVPARCAASVDPIEALRNE
jgi:ABC-type antimicrobial peptide transport system permease subunit